MSKYELKNNKLLSKVMFVVLSVIMILGGNGSL